MIISIASGKGGTGKTTIATGLAGILGNRAQLLDCDVEEPNAHLFIQPKTTSTETITTAVPAVNDSRCTLCGKCDEICQFKAIVVIKDTAVMTFPELCHSCGGCMAVCPENAISETTRDIGVRHRGQRDGIDLVYGKLRVGEAMAPPLIHAVRQLADPQKITLIDAPPGTSCPVIAALRGTDFVLLVTEPTPFGLHDLKLAVGAVQTLGIPCGLVINRSDIGDRAVWDYAGQTGIPILMELPFDRQIAECYSRGDLPALQIPSLKQRFVDLFDQICALIPVKGTDK